MNNTKINILLAQMNNYGLTIDPTFNVLYSNQKNNELKKVLLLLHSSFYQLFNIMKSRMQHKWSGNYVSNIHFPANSSREFIEIIAFWKEISRESIETNNDFKKILRELEPQLSSSGGSTIQWSKSVLEQSFFEDLFYECEIITNNLGKIINPTRVGGGSFAEVFKYYDTTLDKWFAFKKLTNNLDPSYIQRFKNEFNILKSLSYCPYVIKVYKFDTDKNRFIMDFCELGTLKEYIQKNNQTLTLDFRKEMCIQLLQGLKQIHEKNIFHRDLSYNNILVTQDGDKIILKISDFGLCKDLNNQYTKTHESMKGHHIDPFLNNFNDFNFKNEIFSLAFVLQFIINGNESIDLNNKFFTSMIGELKNRPTELKQIYDYIVSINE